MPKAMGDSFDKKSDIPVVLANYPLSVFR